MRITFVLPELSLAGGIRVIAIFAQNLQSRGHSVCVVHWPPREPRWRDLAISVIKKRKLLKRPSQRSHFDGAHLPMKRLGARRPIKDGDVPDADVVVATWWETAAPVAALSDSKGAKAYFMQDYGAPGQELEKVRLTWTLPMHYITIAQWLKDLIQHENAAAIVSLVPNAVDAGKFNAPPRGKQPSPTIGFIYRSTHSKGYDIAIEAAKIAQGSVADLRVLIVSQEEPPQDLPSFATYYRGISDEELKEVYSSCDAWIFPSRIEGYGLPITEAMACRTPVIATPAGAAPELIPGAGILLGSSDNADEMANAMKTIARMPEREWRELSAAARQKIEAYSWDDATDLFEQALIAASDAKQWNQNDEIAAT